MPARNGAIFIFYADTATDRWKPSDAEIYALEIISLITLISRKHVSRNNIIISFDFFQMLGDCFSMPN